MGRKGIIKIAVAGGLGHIGLVQAACLAEKGYLTVAFDSDQSKLLKAQQGQLPFIEAGLDELVIKNLRSERLQFTSDVDQVGEAEVVFVCVGTPSLPSGEADTSSVEAVVEAVARNRQKPCLLVIRSTVPVGTARRINGGLERMGLSGEVTLVSNPEFLREGSAVSDFNQPARIVAGAEDSLTAERVARLYALPQVPMVITSWENAELIKYASNAFLAMKISFINELSRLAGKTGCDIREIKRGVGLDPRVGPCFLDAGVGFSGPCLEKDLRSLICQFDHAGEKAALLQAVWDVNEGQRVRLIEKLERELGGLSGRKVTVLGLAFKPHTDDVRNSHSLPMIKRLLGKGARVTVQDPWLITPSRVDLGGAARDLEAVVWAKCPYEAATGSEGLLVLTDWPQYRSLDLVRLADLMKRPLVVDGRNLFDRAEADRAGLEYHGVGI